MAEPRIILLVEDNPSDEELILQALKQSHVLNEVVVVRDGEEALEYLLGETKSSNQNTPPILPQVVVLDLKLPKLGGLDVVKCIRSDLRTQFLPVVF